MQSCFSLLKGEGLPLPTRESADHHAGGGKGGPVSILRMNHHAVTTRHLTSLEWITSQPRLGIILEVGTSFAREGRIPCFLGRGCSPPCVPPPMGVHLVGGPFHVRGGLSPPTAHSSLNFLYRNIKSFCFSAFALLPGKVT